MKEENGGSQVSYSLRCHRLPVVSKRSDFIVGRFVGDIIRGYRIDIGRKALFLALFYGKYFNLLQPKKL